jgi:GDSL-like lipase/acylhydrolase family protein
MEGASRGGSRLKLGIRVLALGVGLAGGLGALEILAARIPADSAPRATKGFFRDVPLNSSGFRDYEYPRAKPAGHFRIVVLGDSFTRGGAVNFDDSYPKRLERYLNTFGLPGAPLFEVLDMAVAGTSTPEQADLLWRRAEKLSPDLVVLGFCLNDAEDMSRRDELRRLREADHVGFFQKPEGAHGFLYQHSALVRLVAHRVFNARTYRGQIRYYRALYRDDYSGWQRTRQALADIGRFAQEKGTPVAAVVFPLFSWGLGDDYPFVEIHEKIHRALDEVGIPYRDLLEFYRYMDRERLEALPFRDPHPSEIAHRIAAESLWRFLVDRRLVPETFEERGARRAVPAPFDTAARTALSDRSNRASSAASAR